MINLLLLQIAFLVLVVIGQGTGISLPRQPDADAHVDRLPGGEAAQHDGHFIERLLPLIFEEQLLELGDDRLLSGVGLRDVLLRVRVVAGFLGLFEQGHHLAHLLVAEPAEHGADGAQHLHVLAIDAVALELADDARELFADALGGALNLLLLQLILQQTLGTRRGDLGEDGGGNGKGEQQRGRARE